MRDRRRATFPRNPTQTGDASHLAVLEQLSTDYSPAFRRYCSRPDENGLQAAYEIGRTAVVAGVGVLDLVQVHHTTVLHEVQQLHDLEDVAGIADAASCFLTEALGPYEMTYRGYQEHQQNANGARRTDDANEHP